MTRIELPNPWEFVSYDEFDHDMTITTQRFPTPAGDVLRTVTTAPEMPPSVAMVFVPRLIEPANVKPREKENDAVTW